jgi:hypothetical protein
MWKYTMLQNRVYSLNCITNIVCINRIMYTCIYILIYPCSCMSNTNTTQCYEFAPGIKRRLTHFELHPTHTLWYTLSPELPQALLSILSVSLWLTPPTETKGSPLLEYMNSYVKDCISAWLQSEPDYTGDNCSLLCMMLVNTSQVQLKWVPSCLRIVSSQGQWRVSRNVPQEISTDTLYMILSAWNSIPQSVLSDVLDLTRKCLM